MGVAAWIKPLKEEQEEGAVKGAVISYFLLSPRSVLVMAKNFSKAGL